MKDKKRDNCKKISNSNCDRICAYVHKETANKKYKWKSNDKFNVAMLLDNRIKVDIKSEEYNDLKNLMFLI